MTSPSTKTIAGTIGGAVGVIAGALLGYLTEMPVEAVGIIAPAIGVIFTGALSYFVPERRPSPSAVTAVELARFAADDVG